MKASPHANKQDETRASTAISSSKEFVLMTRESRSMRELSLALNQVEDELEQKKMPPIGEILRPGIILFDPQDLEKKPSRKSFQLELHVPEEHVPEDDDDDVHVDEENNQQEHEQDDAQQKNDQIRKNVILEICETEKNYVKAIRTLHDYYIVPLLEKKPTDQMRPIMEDAQIAVFFNNLRNLVMLNSKLLNDLLQIMAERNWSNGKAKNSSSGNNSKSPVAPKEGIGAVFCRYGPLFKLYAGYAKDYEEVAQLLNGYRQDPRLDFTAFLEACREKSNFDKNFESLLIMPIQRIPRYKLLLERVYKYTPDGHPDKGKLQEAVVCVSFAASLINETVRHQENLETVLKTQKQFVGQLSLCTSNRRLIKSGKLMKMSTKRQEEVMIHLFNDLLLYSGVLITGGYRIRRIVYLSSKAVGVKSKAPPSYKSLFQARNLSSDCGFVVTSLEKTFILFASTPEEQAQWVDAIATAIQDAQQHTVNTTDEGPADAAALWVPDAFAGCCTICRSAFKLYFRRHHCRRCGAVVCGNCSSKRSILFVADSAREERVCNPCFKVLDLVKKIAFWWLGRLVEFRGVLRRKRHHKWAEHYYELRAGVLKQYTLASASGNGLKTCTDSLELAGAIVIHRSDSRTQKNRYCFQISTSGYDLGMMETEMFPSSESGGSTNNLMLKLSPLKQAVSRFGEAVRSRDSVRNQESANTPMSDNSLQSSFNSKSASSSQINDSTGWILCATSYEEEVQWRDMIQRSADKALNQLRRSRITEGMFSLSIDREHSVVRVSSFSGRPSDAGDSFSDDSAKTEHRRSQIFKEIIRSEESYVTCLGECIRIYVQPLLLRQLEGQKLFRRRQSRYKKSILHPFGSAGNALTASASSGGSFAQRTFSSSSIQNVRTVRKFGGTPGSILTAPDAKPKNGTSQLQKLLVLDADMAIFFTSVDQICTLNQQLLEHLSRHREEISTHKDEAERIHRAGAIFNAYAPLFQLYTSYASRHESALNAIDSPQFAGFLKEMPEEASANRLRTYLNMPMERIPRYKMLLQELLEWTHPDHIDYMPLQAAISSINMVAYKIQDISDRRENARKIEEIGTKVGIDLRGKWFVKEGTLRKVCRSKVQKYYFVLLEDAVIYGGLGGGLKKKKFRLIDLWECKVSNDTESMPGVINTVANSHNAFCFYSPLKSFILLADSEEEKVSWTTSIQECITRTLRGPTCVRRASIRSDLFLDDEEQASEYELESAFVIKNGWLNVMTDEMKRPRRLWISLTLQNITLATTFKSAQPEESISIDLCEAAPLKHEAYFQLTILPENFQATKKIYRFEAQSLAEREEWLRALVHCTSGHEMPQLIEMRRRSLNNAALAPIFMFDKVSNVCTICTHSFAVYRPRHHCRLCGSLVCGNCSKRKWTLSYSSSKKPSRICDSCADSTGGNITGSLAIDS